MPSDSSDVDNALIAKLGADATLLALMPNGVYLDEAPQGSTRFVIVSLIDEHDAAMFEARAFEDALYLVKAVALSTAGGNVKDAAARIDALLENGTLAISGYKLMTMSRESRIRSTEVDEIDGSIRWQHRGGRYRVQVSVG
jgi:hypothetical protein